MEAGKIPTPSPRLGYIDVGARGGSAERLVPFLAQLDRVLVESDRQEALRLIEASGNGELYKVIPVALGHIDGDINVYIAKNPTCTSALPVSKKFLQEYGISHHFEIQATECMTCARYDTLYSHGGLPIPHIIKADVQGFEYEVLLGFGHFLHECLILEIETHFYEVYSGQRLFGDMVLFLSKFGFVLRSLTLPRSPSLKGDPHFDGDLVEIDAVFSKNRSWLAKQTQHTRELFRSACDVMAVDPYSGY